MWCLENVIPESGPAVRATNPMTLCSIRGFFQGFRARRQWFHTEVSGTVLRIDSPSEGGFVTAPWRQSVHHVDEALGVQRWWQLQVRGFPRMVGFPNNYLVHFGVFWGYPHFRKHPYKYCISCLFHVQKTICQKHLNRKFGRMLDRCTTKVIQK